MMLDAQVFKNPTRTTTPCQSGREFDAFWSQPYVDHTNIVAQLFPWARMLTRSIALCATIDDSSHFSRIPVETCGCGYWTPNRLRFQISRWMSRFTCLSGNKFQKMEFWHFAAIFHRLRSPTRGHLMCICRHDAAHCICISPPIFKFIASTQFDVYKCLHKCIECKTTY